MSRLRRLALLLQVLAIAMQYLALAIRHHSYPWQGTLTGVQLILMTTQIWLYRRHQKVTR